MTRRRSPSDELSLLRSENKRLKLQLDQLRKKLDIIADVLATPLSTGWVKTGDTPALTEDDNGAY